MILTQLVDYIRKRNPYYYWKPFRKVIVRPKAKFIFLRNIKTPINPWKMMLRGLGWRSNDGAIFEHAPFFKCSTPWFTILIIWSFAHDHQDQYIIDESLWEYMIDYRTSPAIKHKMELISWTERRDNVATDHCLGQYKFLWKSR